MKETLELIVKNLVAEPDAVSINVVEGEKSTVLEFKVADADMGKVIGKQGRIAKAIREIVRAVASKEQKRVTVEFID